MTKQTGIGVTNSIDDDTGTPVACGPDITNFDLAMPRGVDDVTGVTQVAYDRLLLLADATFNPTGVMNPALSHTVFDSISTTSVPRTVAVDLGTPTWSNEFLFTDYAVTRDTSGSLRWSAPGVLTGGVINAWA